MSQLLPVLKQAGYKENEQVFFKEKLIDSTAAPVIAYGTDEGNRIAYEGAINEADFSSRLPGIRQQALINLQAIVPEVEVQEAEGTKIAFVSGHEYACEKIMDVDFMKNIARKVGCHQLMVGIPFKGTLIAADANSGIKFKFPAIIKNYFDNPQSEPISDMVFILQNGEIIAMAGENIQDEQTNKYVVAEQAIGEFTITLKSADTKDLFEYINEALDQTVSLLIARKQLRSALHYYLPSSTLLTVKLIVDLDRFAAEVGRSTEDRIPVFFYSGNKQIAPTKINNGIVEERIPFSELTEQELRNEFYILTTIPDAQTNASAVALMASLMKEFSNRGIELPSPGARPAGGNKKWWQFWK